MGQRVSSDAVEDDAGQPGRRQASFGLLQEASDPGSSEYQRGGVGMGGHWTRVIHAEGGAPPRGRAGNTMMMKNSLPSPDSLASSSSSRLQSGDHGGHVTPLLAAPHLLLIFKGPQGT